MSIPIKFKRTIWRSGGSLVVTIPLELLGAYNLREGNEVNVFGSNGKIIIETKEDK